MSNDNFRIPVFLIASGRWLILALSPMLFIFSAHAQPYKYLVLEGGGIRGIAYPGALQVLEQKHITPGIEKVAGTSVGAIVATLMAFGYNADQIRDIMMGLNIKSFNDGGWFFVGGIRRTKKNYGWYRGNKLEHWIATQVKNKTGNENTTLLQLHQLAQSDHRYKDLYITATNLSRQQLEVFNWQTHPNLPVKYAVRASVSIPLYYSAIFMDSAGHISKSRKHCPNCDVLADGGLVANYPLNVFNDSGSKGISPHTLGLKLERPEQIAYNKHDSGLAPYSIRSFKTYIAALYNLTIEQLNNDYTRAEEAQHTIYISDGNYSPRVRHITKKQKEDLFNCGVKGAERFFEGR